MKIEDGMVYIEYDNVQFRVKLNGEIEIYRKRWITWSNIRMLGKSYYINFHDAHKYLTRHNKISLYNAT